VIDAALQTFTFGQLEIRRVESPEHQKRSIRQYFESQVDDETIEHLEKVASEHIFGHP
jgi:hypothetical protein